MRCFRCVQRDPLKWQAAELDGLLGDAEAVRALEGSTTSQLPISEWFGQAGWVAPLNLPLELSALELIAGSRPSEIHVRVAIGLRWAVHGPSRPTSGSELRCPALAEALSRSSKFSWEEFSDFGLQVRTLLILRDGRLLDAEQPCNWLHRLAGRR